MKTYLTFLLFTLVSFAAIGQTQVTKIQGSLIEAGTREAVVGATIRLEGTTIGTLSNLDGAFELLASGQEGTTATLEISFVGFEKILKEVTLNRATVNLGEIALKPSVVGMEEVLVLASVAIDRKTPVAVSTVRPEFIQEKLGTQEFPEILKSTPGVYTTKQGGGYGDSRINIRGFDMRNTAVMVNGVPVNDMENGWVYWSNWAGLSDVARTIQVQRGLGASKIAVPSVGGTINILTKTTDAEKGGNVQMMIGNNGFRKTGLTLSTGLMDNNFAVTFMGTRSEGDGWVDGTWHDAWSYFLNVSKKWNNHILSLTALGSPQRHGQRSSKADPSVYKQYGRQYNSEWGYKNGQMFNLRENFYHKPQISLNHYWTISDKTDLATSAYVSFGTGGGTGSLGEEQSKFYNYKTADGLIDIDRIIAENQENGNKGASAILRASRNDHNWYGVLSNLTHRVNDRLTLSGGFDLRAYQGKHFREVTDLLGGEFYMDTRDMNNPTHFAKVGDVIDYNNLGEVAWGGTFAQAEYTLGELTAFVSGSFSNVSFRRTDYFNYLNTDEAQQSDWYSFQGYSVKGGANFNLTEQQNVFFNAGYFERPPLFNAVFFSYNSNDVNPEARTEKTLGLELGYGLKLNKLSLNVNAYHTEWRDKAFVRRFFDNDGNIFLFNMSGVNALHQGVELDFVYRPFKAVEFTGMASVGDWRWTNDLKDVQVYNDSQELLGTINMYTKDLKVGDAAQTTFALGANLFLTDDLKIGANFNHYDDLYAYYDPAGRTNAEERGEQVWEVPSYNLLDVNLRYNFQVAGMSATLIGNVNNVLDTEYISEANSETAVYYGLGRTWSLGMKLNF
ncbi:TonB-dependent receptor [Algivirga pacifica]|uniref:TonB-dependent receptor n=1 Tax=Algivirga pacifica TaxID=1162670 RepID=A0ABP9CVS2_9BACT